MIWQIQLVVYVVTLVVILLFSRWNRRRGFDAGYVAGTDKQRKQMEFVMGTALRGAESASLSFSTFQAANVTRCRDVFHHEHDWTIQDWCLALAGEAGEACNLAKKIKRGDFTLEEKKADMGRELADVITYADLALSRLELNTGETVALKFNEVSQRHKWDRIVLEAN